MNKVLLIDDKPVFHWLWKLGIAERFDFLQAYTIQQARDLFNSHPDITAIVVDACMDGPSQISLRIPIVEWGFNTRDLIQVMSQHFQGPIIAAPSQFWHFEVMKLAGCTHHCWKWRVASLLNKLLAS